MSITWRLLVDESPGDGAWNMALDKAIQVARRDGESPPTLRLYRWRRPTVTLGRFQDSAGIDSGLCGREGIDVVRRFTGGRGVLHDDEVTYSVAGSVDDGIPHGTTPSYRLLCTALAETYRLLGVDAQLTSRSRGDRTSAACYLHATRADLSLGYAKLSGSAQVWIGDTVLQHGSFTRTRDVTREAAVFGLSPNSTRRLHATTATLGDVLGESPSVETIIESAREAFARILDAEFENGDITTRELQHVDGLLDETRI